MLTRVRSRPVKHSRVESPKFEIGESMTNEVLKTVF